MTYDPSLGCLVVACLIGQEDKALKIIYESFNNFVHDVFTQEQEMDKLEGDRDKVGQKSLQDTLGQR